MCADWSTEETKERSKGFTGAQAAALCEGHTPAERKYSTASHKFYTRVRINRLIAQLPKGNGAGSGDIEGVNAVCHRDAHRVVAASDGGRRKAVSFSA